MSSRMSSYSNVINDNKDGFFMINYFSTSESNIGYDEQSVKDLLEDLKKLYEDKGSMDVIFKFGNEEVKAHKDVLSARSFVFQELFLAKDSEKFGFQRKDSKDHIEFEVPEAYNKEIFERILKYIYYGYIDESKMNSSKDDPQIELFKMASVFDLKQLKRHEEVELEKRLKNEKTAKDNLLVLLRVSHRYHSKNLKQACFDYINKSGMPSLKDEKWNKFIKGENDKDNELVKELFKSVKKN